MLGATAVYLLGSLGMGSDDRQTQSGAQFHIDVVPTVPLCEVAQNPRIYDGRLVRVEGVVYCSQPYYEDARWFYISGSGCGDREPAKVRVELDPSFKPNAKVKEWLDELLKLEGGIKGKESHAVIVGRFDPWHDRDICNVCIMEVLRVTAIEHTSTITRIP